MRLTADPMGRIGLGVADLHITEVEPETKLKINNYYHKDQYYLDIDIKFYSA